MQDPVSERGTAEVSGFRGSNQSGMRAHNERLVLTLVRRDGALAKSDIARMTGLSAQTVSVIMRALEADGLLVRGAPIRGRIGQPSVPLRLAADGAFFFGLKIGRRSVDLVLVNFLGAVIGFRRQTYRYPVPEVVVRFVAGALPELTLAIAPGQRTRIGGLGIAMPFQLWSWAQMIDAPQSELDAWRHRDIAAELAALCQLPVLVQNDATAACGAELVFGTGEKPKDFLYFYVGYFIGGGLVLNRQLFQGRTGNAAGVGPMPVPGSDGQMRRLMSVASMATLAGMIERAGMIGRASAGSEQLWETPGTWRIDESVLADWIRAAAEGLASAILSAAALLELDAVLIDGWLPAGIRREITGQTRAALYRLDLAGITPPEVREGTVGPQARALGAAAIPLSQRYLVDQNAFAKDS